MEKIIQKQNPGLFDYMNRMKKLEQKGCPLDKLDRVIRWKMFEEIMEEALKRESAQGPGGRPRYEPLMMFKILVLQRYYNLSEEQTEYQINDRLSFQRFVGLSLADEVPDKNTIWDFKQRLVKDGKMGKLFKRFEEHLKEKGLVASEGKIVDASFVDVPRQRNSREENEAIKEGKTPEGWEGKAAKTRQKDVDARWASKGKEVHYGYKDHVKVDQKSKLIEDYEVTDASVHDSQKIEELVEKGDGQVYADSAYRSEEIEKKLKEKEIKSQIHERPYRNHSLSEDQKEKNRQKSRVRVRIEHVFGYMTNSMGGMFLRCIGMKRATAMIGLTNLIYNMARYEQLIRLSNTS